MPRWSKGKIPLSQLEGPQFEPRCRQNLLQLTELFLVWDFFKKTSGLRHQRFTAQSVVFTWCLGRISTCYVSYRGVVCSSELSQEKRCNLLWKYPITQPLLPPPIQDDFQMNSQRTSLTKNSSGSHPRTSTIQQKSTWSGSRQVWPWLLVNTYSAIWHGTTTKTSHKSIHITAAHRAAEKQCTASPSRNTSVITDAWTTSKQVNFPHNWSVEDT